MKTNIKSLRKLLLIFGLAIFVFFPLNSARADLDKNFRENFAEITHQQCFNSIDYSVDDISGFELIEIGSGENKNSEWQCKDGKCEEYQSMVNCLFDDAFGQAVNKTNNTITNSLSQNFAELHNTQIYNLQECVQGVQNNLWSIQERQESLGFTSDCSGEALGKFYSACRVTETVLNELCGYQNFLTAKSRDFKSFRKEKSNYRIEKNNQKTAFNEKSAKYLVEIEKSQKAFLSTVTLYKNFIHNYRIHAWIVAIKTKLKSVTGTWQKIHQAIETFPTKFIDASSVNS